MCGKYASEIASIDGCVNIINRDAPGLFMYDQPIPMKEPSAS